MEQAIFGRPAQDPPRIASLVAQTIQQEVQPPSNERKSFEPAPEEEEAMQARREMFHASQTKFATGNPQQDVENYRKIRTIAAELMGLLNG